ncbi:MAG TPA: 50S ribosomal protein L25, partial [Burkholderiaceae bacterium]|nr:50S ribosomal protein L25 [Burkholderiaceae bacterium]
PWKQQVLHIDFQRIDPTTRLRIKVPLHYSGEENAPAVKTDKCLVNHVATDVEVECLATQLPEFIAVDLSGLAKGQSLHVSDIVPPSGVRIVRHGKLNPVIVAVTMPKAEEEETATADAAAAGAAPAAGAAAAPAAAAAAAPAAAKTAKAPAAPAKDDKKKK